MQTYKIGLAWCSYTTEIASDTNFTVFNISSPVDIVFLCNWWYAMATDPQVTAAYNDKLKQSGQCVFLDARQSVDERDIS